MKEPGLTKDRPLSHTPTHLWLLENINCGAPNSPSSQGNGGCFAGGETRLQDTARFGPRPRLPLNPALGTASYCLAEISSPGSPFTARWAVLPLGSPYRQSGRKAPLNSRAQSWHQLACEQGWPAKKSLLEAAVLWEGGGRELGALHAGSCSPPTSHTCCIFQVSE